MTLLGLDIGSSSVKATLLDAESGKVVASATCPKVEMSIIALKPGWAEQKPEDWWQNIKDAVAQIKASNPKELDELKAIGVTYQMHGLVLLDKAGTVLRPSIIWCDSRAVGYGEKAFASIGKEKCLTHLLNSPGNFTASKLAWVKENEPQVYAKADKMMLPGDYISYKLTGEICTSSTGLSEGILWDMVADKPADFLMDYYGFSKTLLPEVKPTFGVQGQVSAAAAAELGLKAGVPVSYRAGDQPNNAFSLNVLEPGELATTAGTSGVVYGIVGKPVYDNDSRVNSFVHVNHTAQKNRYGVLLCLNGTGILNRWLKLNAVDMPGQPSSYPAMDEFASKAPIGSEGLTVLPYGNGAERTLLNKDLGCSFEGINFNIHTRSHMIRASQEGIVFALNYGLEIMKGMGLEVKTIRAGFANMFMSPLFSDAIATTTGAKVELFSTDGAQGAARGAGYGAGIYSSFAQTFNGLEKKKTIEPSGKDAAAYGEAYARWKKALEKKLK
jgi:xylulokinase